MRKIAYETPHMDVVVLDEDVILTSTGTQCNFTDGCDGDLICGGYQVISGGGSGGGVVSGGGTISGGGSISGGGGSACNGDSDGGIVCGNGG